MCGVLNDRRSPMAVSGSDREGGQIRDKSMQQNQTDKQTTETPIP
jgi:hypothetical protein